MPKRKERMAGYIRESDPTQADSTTIESAAKAVREYGENQGYIYEPRHEYKEAISAHSVPYFQRPELMKALKAAERHEFDVFVITEVRALSRKGAGEVFIIYDSLQKSSVRLETITEKFSDDPMGEMVLTFKATYARLEREQSYLRMQRGKKDRIELGKATNGHPKAAYGYRFVDTDREVKGAYEFNHEIIYIEPDGTTWSEYKVVVFIFDLLLHGESLHSVARILNEKGIPPRWKAVKQLPHWRASGVRNLVNNPIYIGEVWANRFKKIEKENRNKEKKMTQIDRPKEEWIRLPDAPAIIDRETYAAVQVQIASNKNESLRNNKHTDELGLVRAGFCKCGVCGRTMTVDYPGPVAISRNTTPGYRCQHRSGVTLGTTYNHNTFIRVSVIDASVREKIMEVLQDTTWVRARVAELREENTPTVDPEVVNATIERIQAEIDNWFEMAKYATNDKNRERFGMMLQDLEAQQRETAAMLYDIEDEEEEQAQIEAEIVKFEKWAESVKPFLTDPTYKPTYLELRLAVKILGILVTVYPSKGDWPCRYQIDVTVPALLAKVKPYSGFSQPSASSPVSSRLFGPSVAR